MTKGRKPSEHCTRWTPQEDAYLKKHLCEGDDREVIAKDLHRTLSSINGRIQTIGLSIERTQKPKPVAKKATAVKKTKPVAKKTMASHKAAASKDIAKHDKYTGIIGELQFWADWNDLEFRGIELQKDGKSFIARFNA